MEGTDHVEGNQDHLPLHDLRQEVQRGGTQSAPKDTARRGFGRMADVPVWVVHLWDERR